MGFKGVVVSDALDMAGISGYYENQLETEIECFKAGADILLWPRFEIIDSLEMRILRKEIPIERLNDAVSRVWNLKKQLGLLDDNYSSIQALSDKELEENKKKAYQIAEKSVTLLDDKNKQLPLDTTKSKKLLIVSVSEKKGAEVFDIMKKELLKRGYEVEVRDDLPYFELGESLESLSAKYDKFIFTFFSNPGNPWGTLSLNNSKALSMWTANKLPLNKVISIGFGDPYKNLIYMPRIWCRINCYQTDDNTQLTLVKGLTGEIELTGKSPVTYNAPYYQGN
jgi:beta-N-acetylhexosaminidase